MARRENRGGFRPGAGAKPKALKDRQRNHIYQVNDISSDDAVRVWHNASGANGNLPPNRTISNSAGLLDQARALSFISQLGEQSRRADRR